MKYIWKISGIMVVSFAAFACVLAPSTLLAQEMEDEEAVEEVLPPKKKATGVKTQDIKKSAEEEDTMEEALPPRKKAARARPQDIEPKKERPPFRFVPEGGDEEAGEGEESRGYKKRSRRVEEEESEEAAPPPPRRAPVRVPVEIEEVGAEGAKEDYKFLVTGVVSKEGGLETTVEVTNQSGKIHSKLTVEISFFDSDGGLLSKQKMSVDVSKISPDATAKKRFLIRNPPEGVAEVEGKVLSVQ